MHRCRICGAVFEDLIEIHLPGGCYEADYGVYSDFNSHTYYGPSEYMGCPECQSHEDDVEDVQECEMCGNYFAPYELADGLCEMCVIACYGDDDDES